MSLSDPLYSNPSYMDPDFSEPFAAIICAHDIPGILSRAAYTTLAEAVSNYVKCLSEAIAFTNAAANEVVRTRNTQIIADLVEPFYNVFLVNADLLEFVNLISPSVMATNRHVLVRGHFLDINHFLEEHCIRVPQEWADISEITGFDINEAFISL